MKLVIPNERPWSWNKFYDNKLHWTARVAEKNRVKLAVREVIDPDKAFLFTERVDITMVVYFDKYPLDSDNISDKMYIDALKGWYIKDDNRKHVRATTTISEVDKDNPRVELTITEEP